MILLGALFPCCLFRFLYVVELTCCFTIQTLHGTTSVNLFLQHLYRSTIAGVHCQYSFTVFMVASFRGPHQYSLAGTKKVMISHAAEGLSPYSFFMDSDAPEFFFFLLTLQLKKIWLCFSKSHLSCLSFSNFISLS